MKPTLFKANVALITIVSGFIALSSYVLVAASVNYNFEVFSDVSLLLTLPGIKTEMLRWSMILDIFGYYFLLLPAIILMAEWLKSETPWSSFLHVCAIIYVITGAIGASILAVSWPSLISQYSTNDQVITKRLFIFISNIVYGGLWNLLGMLSAGIWWIGIGATINKQHKAFGFFTVFLGLAALADSLGGIFNLKALADMGLNSYLVLAPLWAIWLGFTLRKIDLPASSII